MHSFVGLMTAGLDGRLPTKALRRQAAEDPDPQVREAAKQILMKRSAW
jgi:hypothetical protein